MATPAEDKARYDGIVTDLHDYADYFELDDLTRGLKYFTALNRAIDFRPQVSSRGSQGDELRFDLQTLRQKLDDLKRWLLAKRRSTSAGGAQYPNLVRCDR